MLYFKGKVTLFACNIFVQISGVFKTIIKSILSILVAFFWFFVFFIPLWLLFDGSGEYLTSSLESKDKNE